MVYLLLDMFRGIYFLNKESSKKKVTINTIIYCPLHVRQDCSLLLPTILSVVLNQCPTHAVIGRARVQSDQFIINPMTLIIRLEITVLPLNRKGKNRNIAMKHLSLELRVLLYSASFLPDLPSPPVI